MGTRVNYFLVSDIDCEESQISAIFFSNNCHSNYDPEERFKALASESLGVTELAAKLLNETYPSDMTDRIERQFCLDSTAGDNERVMLVYWESGEELAERGYIQPTKPVLKELPALTPPLMAEVRKHL